MFECYYLLRKVFTSLQWQIVLDTVPSQFCFKGDTDNFMNTYFFLQGMIFFADREKKTCEKNYQTHKKVHATQPVVDYFGNEGHGCCL